MGTDDPQGAMTVTIRPARAEDLDAVFALTREFATSFQPKIEFFRASFERLIAQADAMLLVAVQGDRMVGYLLGFDHDTLFANGRVAWIEELIVHAQRRRCGVATRLVEHFEQWARSRGNVVVAVATRRAASFYSAVRYEESAAYYRKLL